MIATFPLLQYVQISSHSLNQIDKITLYDSFSPANYYIVFAYYYAPLHWKILIGCLQLKYRKEKL